MTTIIEEFDDRHDNPPTEIEKVILFGILDDLSERSGGFDILSLDEEEQEEILEMNLERIRAAMTR